MGIEFSRVHLEKFKASLKSPIDPWGGLNAKRWAEYFDEDVNPVLDRRFLREDFANTKLVSELSDRELAYAILSWGGMNREHGRIAFERDGWLEVIGIMRRKECTRSEAYDLFLEHRRNRTLKGIGPAFFTKLICFVNPSINGYIMDQWLSKSINILIDRPLVRIANSGYVTDDNNSKTYEHFCCIIEELANNLSMTPLAVEERLFSNGGRNMGEWRRYVINNEQRRTTRSLKRAKDVNVSSYDSLEKASFMESVSYDNVLGSLNENWLEMPTLGGNSTIRVRSNGEHIVIMNSRGSQMVIDRNHWAAVMQRIDDLPVYERAMTSRYVQGNNSYNWTACPNRIFSPYVPAVVMRYVIDGLNEK